MTVLEEIWSDEYLVRLERAIWIEVMKVHRRHGLVEDEQLFESIAVWDTVDLASIHEREMRLKHDLMARLEEFAALSGHQRIHLGMTSADIVENTYWIRIRRSVELLPLEDPGPILARMPFRGIRGPIGNDSDQLNLLGSPEAVRDLNLLIASRFGFPPDSVTNAVSQNLPRSYDLAVATSLVSELVKDRAQSVIANGYLTMFSGMHFWLEGDVATSVVRRHAWPKLFELLDNQPEEE